MANFEGENDPTPRFWKKNKEYPLSNGSSSSPSSWRSSGAPIAIPRDKGPDKHGTQNSSAPSMDGQDWSRISKKEETFLEMEEEDDGKMIPPHEYIAKRLARTKISSSMCEGNGRTLKGRDLRKVRNDILTKTGFLE